MLHSLAMDTCATEPGGALLPGDALVRCDLSVVVISIRDVS